MATAMLVSGFLLAIMCRMDMFGHFFPQWFWTALTVAVSIWLIVAIAQMRRAPLLIVPAVILLYLFPFNLTVLKPVGIPNESRLLEYLQSNNAVGAAVGIHVRGKTFFAGYGGVKKFGDLPTSHTQYQIASITKTFTGDVLSRQFDPALVPLATHSSGLPDITEGEGFLMHFLSHPFDFYAHYEFDDLQRDLLFFQETAKTNVISAAGKWRYSNLGFCSLGITLGMGGRRFGNIGYERTKEIAAGYNAASVRTTLWSPGVCHGAGGLQASAADLLHFARLPSAAKVIYFDDGERQMGLGWMFKDGIWYHGGATFGNTTFVAHEPSSDTAVVLLISGVTQEIDSFGLDFIKCIVSLSDDQKSVPNNPCREAASFKRKR